MCQYLKRQVAVERLAPATAVGGRERTRTLRSIRKQSGPHMMAVMYDVN